MRFILLLLTVSSVASCCANKNTSKESLMDNDEPKTYIINQLFDYSVGEENVTITLNYEEKIISGYSGCNNFSGSFTEENGEIKIGPIASTKKICPDVSNEDLLYKALSNTFKLTIDSTKLEFLNSSGESVLKASTYEKVESKSQDKITFEYTARSRGFYLTIYISNIDNMLLVTTHQDMKPARQSFTNEEWENLITSLDNIDLKEIENIEPPSKAHQYDGAALANLKITMNSNVYQSKPFDHGNPSEELKELIDHLISFSERE